MHHYFSHKSNKYVYNIRVMGLFNYSKIEPTIF